MNVQANIKKKIMFTECEERIPKTVVEDLLRFEEIFDKPVEEMNGAEMINLVSMYKSINSVFIRKILTTIRRYLKWCSSNGERFDGSLAMVQTPDIDTTVYLEDVIMENNDEILELDNIYPADEGYPDALVLSLAWHGITVDESVELKIKPNTFKMLPDGSSEIKVGERIVTLDEKTTKILNVYNSVSSTRWGASRRAVPQRPDGKLIYSMKGNDKISANGLAGAIKDRLDKIGKDKKRYNITTIELSGKMKRMYLDEKAGRIPPIVGPRTAENMIYMDYKKCFYGE